MPIKRTKAGEKITTDSNGNEILYEIGEYWEERTYDEQDNLIHYENSNMDWRTYEYDQDTNLLRYSDSDNYILNNVFDSEGNHISSEDNRGNHWERTYDDRGNELSYINYSTYSRCATYDANDNQLTFSNSRGLKITNIYNAANKLINQIVLEEKFLIQTHNEIFPAFKNKKSLQKLKNML